MEKTYLMIIVVSVAVLIITTVIKYWPTREKRVILKRLNKEDPDNAKQVVEAYGREKGKPVSVFLNTPPERTRPLVFTFTVYIGRHCYRYYRKNELWRIG